MRTINGSEQMNGSDVGQINYNGIQNNWKTKFLMQTNIGRSLRCEVKYNLICAAFSSRVKSEY